MSAARWACVHGALPSPSECTTVTREMTVGGGHAGGELGWTHFGLGQATQAQVRVHWPDGTYGPWLSATADAFGVIQRGATAITPWTPP